VAIDTSKLRPYKNSSIPTIDGGMNKYLSSEFQAIAASTKQLVDTLTATAAEADANVTAITTVAAGVTANSTAITTLQGSRASSTQFGLAKVDGTTITAVAGVISAAALAVAAQSDQETATSTTLAVTPGRQQFHPSSVKAWVIFTGVATPVISASYNVSSVTRTSTGIYVVHFTVPFSSANYACSVTPESTAGTAGWGTVALSGRATGTVTVNFVTAPIAVFDPTTGSVFCFGDQ
jgi:hypothetical protein